MNEDNYTRPERIKLGPTDSGVSTHSGAHRQYLIWGPCLACHKSWSGVPNITSVTNSVNDMACCVISFTALTDLYRTTDSLSPPLSLSLRSLSLSLSLSLYSDGQGSNFEVDSAGQGRTARASPRARGSCHHGSRHRPRVRGARTMPGSSWRLS